MFAEFHGFSFNDKLLSDDVVVLFCISIACFESSSCCRNSIKKTGSYRYIVSFVSLGFTGAASRLEKKNRCRSTAAGHRQRRYFTDTPRSDFTQPRTGFAGPHRALLDLDSVLNRAFRRQYHYGR